MDLIKREDAVQMLVDVIEQAEQNNDIVIVDRPMGWESIRAYAEEVVSDIPSAEKQGEWIEIWENEMSTKAMCNNCKRESDRPLGNFCKWCGADMRGADDA
jgi:hypothetical protein